MPTDRSSRSASVVPTVVVATMTAQNRIRCNRRAEIWARTASTNSAAKIAVPVRYPRFMDMVTASPAVSPSVVAAILISQNNRVTSGTLRSGASGLILSSIKCLSMSIIKRCVLVTLLLLPAAALAQAADVDCDQAPESCTTPLSRSLGAIKAYVTAPQRWDTPEWLLFGGAVVAIGTSHGFDSRVRAHFTENSPASLTGANVDAVQDALPAATLLVGTWTLAHITDDGDGRREAGAMLEATVLSVGTSYVLNYASGRRGPNQTADPNRWWSGGTSFPSQHTTAAFAIGT